MNKFTKTCVGLFSIMSLLFINSCSRKLYYHKDNFWFTTQIEVDTKNKSFKYISLDGHTSSGRITTGRARLTNNILALYSFGETYDSITGSWVLASDTSVLHSPDYYFIFNKKLIPLTSSQFILEENCDSSIATIINDTSYFYDAYYSEILYKGKSKGFKRSLKEFQNSPNVQWD
jgi:hypothetical protein